MVAAIIRDRDREVVQAPLSTCELNEGLAALTGAEELDAPTLQSYICALHPAHAKRLIETAVAERLAPLVYYNLEKAGLLGCLPGACRDLLHLEYRANLLYCAVQVHALERIGAKLDAEGIPFRILKGMALGAQAYPAYDLRGAGDLDIWVRPADLKRVDSIFVRLGLSRPAGYYSQSFSWAYAGEQSYGGGPESGLSVAVDLHWHLVNLWWFRDSLRVPEGSIFGGACPVGLSDGIYRTLTLTNCLYYLCLHSLGGQHGSRWRGLLDIVLLLRKGEVDWRELNAMVEKSGTRTLVWRALDLADETFGCDYSARLKVLPARWHRLLVHKALPASEPGAPSPEMEANAADVTLPLSHLLLIAGPMQAARTLVCMLWPTARWISLRYNVKGRRAIWRARLKHITRLKGLLVQAQNRC